MCNVVAQNRQGKVNKTILAGARTFNHTQNWDIIGQVLAHKAKLQLQPSAELV